MAGGTGGAVRRAAGVIIEMTDANVRIIPGNSATAFRLFRSVTPRAWVGRGIKRRTGYRRRTDARGVAASKPLPLTRYKVVEVTAPAYWQVDPTVHDITLEYAGQIIKVSAYDKPSNLGVTITKRGNAEVLAGQTIRYDLTVANTSNVPLENFYWHDKIPYDVARATTLTTGTYSARLNYRILYKTNYQTTYQVLASNLLTSNNYSFALNAIPMQAGEVVTDIYFDFGKVPVGFQSTAGPTLSVIVNGNTVNGYQLVNRADVGGQYQGTWQTAQASWVTIVRKYTTTPDLPKTGY